MTGRTDQEVSDLQVVLKGHTGVINAIRDDQVDHGKALARVEAGMRTEFADVRAEMRAGFAKVDENFAKVEDKFKVLQRGQELITSLLTRHLGAPDDETQTDGAGE